MDVKELVREMYEKVMRISDLDWSEICEKYDCGIHPDQLRKMGAGIRLAAEAGMLSLDGEKVVSRPYDLQKMRDLRNEMSEIHRAQARSEALREAVEEAAGKLPPIRVEALPTPQSSGKTLVLCMGDFHFGAEWTVKGLYGETLNRYNPEIFAQRMAELLGQVATILAKEGITDVALLMCGDSLDGMLRPSQLMKLRWGVVESCIRFAEYMSAWIGELSRIAHVRVFNVDANHTELRPLGSRRGDFNNENFEKIITWYIAERLKENANVEVDAESEAMKRLDVQGFSFLVTHGTDIKHMENAAKQAMLLYNERIDFLICAHKHREQGAISGYTDSGNSMVIRVPSICGMDDYAQRLGYGGKPGALAMVIEAGYGRRCVYPLQ